MVENKKCANCCEVKPAAEFAKRTNRPNGLQSRCKKCLGEYHKERRTLNPDVYAKYARREHFKNNYKITIEDYDSMMSSQGDKCAGCGRHRNDFKRLLDVDHCHKTGKVRGLLCVSCNLTIGYGKDNPTILRILADYIEAHSI